MMGTEGERMDEAKEDTGEGTRREDSLESVCERER